MQLHSRAKHETRRTTYRAGHRAWLIAIGLLGCPGPDPRRDPGITGGTDPVGGNGGATSTGAGAAGAGASGAAGAGASGAGGSGGAGAGGSGGLETGGGGSGGSGAGGMASGGGGAGGTGGSPTGGGGEGGTGGGSDCMDMQMNGTETDIDCGGETCGKCANGQACGEAADCMSASCINSLCFSCHDAEDETPLAAQGIVLSQFMPVYEGNFDRMVVSPNGANLYWPLYWGGTRVYTRDTTTGGLSLLQGLPWPQAGGVGGSGASFWNGQLYFGRWGAPAGIFYLSPAANGALPASEPTAPPSFIIPSGYASGHDFSAGASIGDHRYFIDNTNVIRRFTNGVWTAAATAPPGVGATRTPRRLGDQLVWLEISNNGVIRRASVGCDGTLTNLQTFATGTDVRGLAACSSTGRLYATDVADPSGAGVVHVINTNDCAQDIATCTKAVATTSQSNPLLSSSPGEIAVSPDCSMLFVSGAIGELVTFSVYSLANPDSPTLIRAFRGGLTYDGVLLGDPGAVPPGKGWSASPITVTPEAVYHGHTFGSGLAVYRFVPAP